MAVFSLRIDKERKKYYNKSTYVWLFRSEYFEEFRGNAEVLNKTEKRKEL